MWVLGRSLWRCTCAWWGIAWFVGLGILARLVFIPLSWRIMSVCGNVGRGIIEHRIRWEDCVRYSAKMDIIR